MANILTIGFYVALAAVVVILILGMVNMARGGEGEASRSNQLMRYRVMAQAAVIGILVLLGIVLGAINI